MREKRKRKRRKKKAMEVDMGPFFILEIDAVGDALTEKKGKRFKILRAGAFLPDGKRSQLGYKPWLRTGASGFYTGAPRILLLQ
ncbi:hypothetical protein [Oryza sativa Japonica Group]|uniref:Uncharacterized protein n=1 Tax=Oryza sativa subsp. japonica TaxID=39947 RepID=Q5SMX1_ORYSJ|nr:hypothetical protein [Oryza sativa Japonica Group]